MVGAEKQRNQQRNQPEKPAARNPRNRETEKPRNQNRETRETSRATFLGKLRCVGGFSEAVGPSRKIRRRHSPPDERARTWRGAGFFCDCVVVQKLGLNRGKLGRGQRFYPRAAPQTDGIVFQGLVCGPGGFLVDAYQITCPTTSTQLMTRIKYSKSCKPSMRLSTFLQLH